MWNLTAKEKQLIKRRDNSWFKFFLSENDILVHIVEQILADNLPLLLATFQLGQQFLGLHVPLLRIEHFLQPEKVLPGLLIQLLIDVSIDVDQSWHDHVLQGVYSAVGHLYLLV